MPLVDPVIERVLADFERRAEEEARRTATPGAPGTSLDDLLLSVGREAGILLYDAFYRWCRDASGETHNWPTNKAKP